MFYHQLRNELWKLFGKKRTYIGFAMFLLAQNIVTLVFKFTRASRPLERMLEGNGHLADQYISTLTIAAIMLIPLDADAGLKHYLAVHALLVTEAGSILGLSFLFSCFNIKPAAATILCLSVLFVNLILEKIPYFHDYQEWFLTYHLHVWQFMFEER